MLTTLHTYFGLAFLCPVDETGRVTARIVAFIGDENAGCAPAFLYGKGRAMQKRRRPTQAMLLQERLALWATKTRKLADVLPAGPKRADLVKKASQADRASQFDDWANSSNLRDPQ
jgi:hypothetical protein